MKYVSLLNYSSLLANPTMCFPFQNTLINSVMNSGTIKSSTIQYIEIELREGEASQVVAGVFTINCNCKVIRSGQSKDFKNGI